MTTRAPATSKYSPFWTGTQKRHQRALVHHRLKKRVEVPGGGRRRSPIRESEGGVTVPPRWVGGSTGSDGRYPNCVKQVSLVVEGAILLQKCSRDIDGWVGGSRGSNGRYPNCVKQLSPGGSGVGESGDRGGSGGGRPPERPREGSGGLRAPSREAPLQQPPPSPTGSSPSMPHCTRPTPVSRASRPHDHRWPPGATGSAAPAQSKPRVISRMKSWPGAARANAWRPRAGSGGVDGRVRVRKDAAVVAGLL